MARMNAQSVASILATTLAVLLAVGLAASSAAPACIAESPCIDWTGRLLIRRGATIPRLSRSSLATSPPTEAIP